MALTVENGNGVSGANSYLSVADADTYHSDRGNSTWSNASNTEKEQALLEATAYLDLTYQSQWKGQPTHGRGSQPLDWPRLWVLDENGEFVDSESIPQRIKDATAELALRSLSETLIPDDSQPGTVKKESVQVGSITRSQEFIGGSPRTNEFKFRKVHLMVGPFLSSFNFNKMERH